jgi:hypothetical protein
VGGAFERAFERFQRIPVDFRSDPDPRFAGKLNVKIPFDRKERGGFEEDEEASLYRVEFEIRCFAGFSRSAGSPKILPRRSQRMCGGRKGSRRANLVVFNYRFQIDPLRPLRNLSDLCGESDLRTFDSAQNFAFQIGRSLPSRPDADPLRAPQNLTRTPANAAIGGAGLMKRLSTPGPLVTAPAGTPGVPIPVGSPYMPKVA